MRVTLAHPFNPDSICVYDMLKFCRPKSSYVIENYVAYTICNQ